MNNASSDFWPGKKCLVTGGMGFGGSHLCEQLLKRGATVYVLDRLRPSNSYLVIAGLIDQCEYIQGDVRDLGLLQSALNRFEIDTVFHLAAQPTVPTSVLLPMETLSVNVLGTYVVLEAVRTSPFRPALVFASSGAYYGATSTSQPIAEEYPAGTAANIYAPSKVAADIAVRCYVKTYDVRAAVCRFINTYGPGNTNFGTIVPQTIFKLMENRPYDFGPRDDGSSTFDYLNIQDMTNGYLKVAENVDRVKGQAFNFSGGNPVSVRDLVKLISRIFDGKEREPVFHGTKRDVAVRKCLDCARAEDILGWRSSIDLKEGLEETIDWYRRFWPVLTEGQSIQRDSITRSYAMA